MHPNHLPFMQSLPIEDASTAPSILLSEEDIVDVAKEVILATPFICDWGQCHTELNSWKTLQEHLHQHFGTRPDIPFLPPSQQILQPGGYECFISKCSGRFHNSLEDMEQHVTLSHLSRILLPCPIEGCPLTFGRNGQQLPEHLYSAHREFVNMTVPLGSPALRPLRTPHPHSLCSLPPLPDRPEPAYMFTAPAICAGHSLQNKPSAKSRGRQRRWKRMHTVQMALEEDSEEEESSGGPFPDLAPWNSHDALGLLWARKAREPALQQSRPQNVPVPPKPNMDPPRTIGYPAFELRFHELEKAGITDGKGVWPRERAQGGSVAPGSDSKAPAGSL